MQSSGETSATIEIILTNALLRLKRMDSYEGYLDYIRHEWYSSISDLLLALEDGEAWTDLKLPGRLKLEIKSELLGLQAPKAVQYSTKQCDDDSVILSAGPAPVTKMRRWVRYFSANDDSFFYYDMETQKTQWEIPSGNIEIEDDLSMQCTPISSEKSSISMSDNHDAKRSGSTGEQMSYTDTTSAHNHGSPAKSALRTTELPEAHKASPISPSFHNNGCEATASPSRSVDVIVVSDAYAINDDYIFGENTTIDLNDATPSLLEDAFATLEEGESDLIMTQRLMEMGFTYTAAVNALESCDNNLSAAASMLLLSRRPSTSTTSTSSPAPVSPRSKQRKIANSIINRLGFRVTPPPPSAPPLESHHLRL